MQCNIESNAARLADNWARRANRFAPAMRKATGNATKTLLAESKSLMTRLIYNKPVPTKAQYSAERGTVTDDGDPATWITTKSGRKVKIKLKGKYAKKRAWTRTGNLRRSEKARVVTAYSGIIYNDARSKSGGYAKARHDLGMAGSKRKSRRKAPWRALAIKHKRARIAQIYRDAMRAAIYR